MRIIVTGSRDWTDRDAVWNALDDIASWRWAYGNVLIHGGCPTGADRMAQDHYEEFGLFTLEIHPADWAKHGKAAGFIRNKEMVDQGADLVLAFQRSGSRGTQHTINLARKAGIEVRLWEAP